jgi:hypothetical protein
MVDNKAIQQEEKRITDHIRNNPYPSYEEMDRRHGDDIMLSAEYGRRNHDALKEIYESGMNKEIAREIGEKIYKRGGTRALQANCTSFARYGPFSNSVFPDVRYNGPKDLESAWDGIGDFMS